MTAPAAATTAAPVTAATMKPRAAVPAPVAAAATATPATTPAATQTALDALKVCWCGARFLCFIACVCKASSSAAAPAAPLRSLVELAPCKPTLRPSLTVASRSRPQKHWARR
jgi:hypothetical protein